MSWDGELGVLHLSRQLATLIWLQETVIVALNSCPYSVVDSEQEL